MCVDPATIMVVTSVASTLVTGYAYYQQGQAQKEAGEYNARIMEQNAQYAEQDQARVEQQAANERRRRAIQGAQAIGDSRARAAAMGVDADFGTYADLQSDIKTAWNIDDSIILQNKNANLEALDREAWGYRSGAALSRAEGESAAWAGKMGAMGSLLQGASTISEKWIQPTKKTPMTGGKAPGGGKIGSGTVIRVGG